MAIPVNSLERAFGRADDDRPRWLLTLSLLSMFAAAGTALVVGFSISFYLCPTTRLSGADIPLAAYVVLGVCSFALIASIFVRERPLLLSLMLSVTACALLTGIVLVARDSAITTRVASCQYGSETVTDHVWYVYVVWGVALAVLLLQLRRAIRFCGGTARS